ncbi:unnamed protein product [Discosporangium mesarthrocarpum]
MAQAQAEEEKARLRQQDDDLLNQALGLAPRTAAVQGNNLDKADLQQLLGKSSEAGAEQEESTERISGLGAAPFFDLQGAREVNVTGLPIPLPFQTVALGYHYSKPRQSCMTTFPSYL